METTADGTVYTIIYEEIDGPYYEERHIKEGIGVIFVERLMFGEQENYKTSYSLFEGSTGIVVDINFLDISQDDWYMKYVLKLLSLDLIDGYPDKTFRPQSEITVAEFIALTLDSLGYRYETEGVEWYAPYISKATDLNIISQNVFDDYSRPITR
ncbi:MAG: S-layer homology domain-containing protein [Clostridiaceae bacterium]|nr:S-layer homology domain-containing protein [Clostridiaceae bacterium]